LLPIDEQFTLVSQIVNFGLHEEYLPDYTTGGKATGEDAAKHSRSSHAMTR
jgi:hypothetical protein